MEEVVEEVVEEVEEVIEAVEQAVTPKVPLTASNCQYNEAFNFNGPGTCSENGECKGYRTCINGNC